MKAETQGYTILSKNRRRSYESQHRKTYTPNQGLRLPNADKSLFVLGEKKATLMQLSRGLL